MFTTRENFDTWQKIINHYAISPTLRHSIKQQSPIPSCSFSSFPLGPPIS
jgi:hypothetical protein